MCPFPQPLSYTTKEYGPAMCFLPKAGKFLKGQKYAGKSIEEGVEFEVPMYTDLASDKL